MCNYARVGGGRDGMNIMNMVYLVKEYAEICLWSDNGGRVWMGHFNYYVLLCKVRENMNKKEGGGKQVERIRRESAIRQLLDQGYTVDHDSKIVERDEVSDIE